MIIESNKVLDKQIISYICKILGWYMVFNSNIRLLIDKVLILNSCKIFICMENDL